MNLLREASFEMRYSSRRTIRAMIAGFAIIAISLIAVAAVALVLMQKVRPPSADSVDARIPTAAYGYAAVQVFDCVRVGPKCENYDKAKNYLIMSTVAGGVEYTPQKDSDPGTDTPGGTKTVKFTKDSSEQEFRDFANAVTMNGGITPITVKETAFTEGAEERTAVFVYNPTKGSGTYDGTITFTLTDQQLVVRKVAYEKAPA